MDRNWIEYEDGPRQLGPENIYVSINRVGDLMLNRFTFEALGKPEAVKLMYDPDTDVIGLRPVSRFMTSAFPLRPKGRSDNKRMPHKTFLRAARYEVRRNGSFPAGGDRKRDPCPRPSQHAIDNPQKTQHEPTELKKNASGFRFRRDLGSKIEAAASYLPADRLARQAIRSCRRRGARRSRR